MRYKLCRAILVCLFFISASAVSQQKEFTLDVESTFQRLVQEVDTDKDRKITIEDRQDPDFWLTDVTGDTVPIRETYHLSNLLQELAIAQNEGQDTLNISLSEIQMPPSERISGRIKNEFWDDLTRTIDRDGIEKILEDSKASDGTQRIYVPYDDQEGQEYFGELAKEMDFEMVVLPENITPQYVKSINTRPGILALALEDGEGVPFVVPGGRFNEMYGWDSYFEGVGLLIDGRIDLAKAMVDNFVYQINHYGKILNANRSYYLTRTQPPFMSSFVREVYEAMEEKDEEWLRTSLSAAIKEYEQVWMEEGKRLTKTGLNRYYAGGIGIPPETEEGHFDRVLQEFAEKHNMSLDEFVEAYQNDELEDEELDEYFLHDRSLRESGHDTSWRLENRTAYLNTVDLNSLLYKYEKDFEYLIENYFDGEFTADNGQTYTAEYWGEKAEERKELMNEYLWNGDAGSFFDYNFKKQEQTGYISATNFYPLWAGLASEEQAEEMVGNLMEDLQATGGILSSAKESVEETATNDVQRQWDYPNGWAPHQMMLWRGLLKYGYEEQVQELIYRWLWMITRNAVDYNGTIPEKYDVVDATHKVYAEYGNVGTEFDYITTSGFGWMNASYQYGLEHLKPGYREKLDELVHPDKLFGE